MGISDDEELDQILGGADVLDKVLTAKPTQKIMGVVGSPTTPTHSDEGLEPQEQSNRELQTRGNPCQGLSLFSSTEVFHTPSVNSPCMHV